MIKRMVMLVLGVFGGLLVALAMQETMGGEWEAVSQNVALGIIFIVVFGIVMAAIMEK